MHIYPTARALQQHRYLAETPAAVSVARSIHIPRDPSLRRGCGELRSVPTTG